MKTWSFSTIIRCNEVGGILSEKIDWDAIEDAPPEIVEAQKQFVEALEKLNGLLKPYDTKVYL